MYTSCLKLQFFAFALLTAKGAYQNTRGQFEITIAALVFLHCAYIRFFTWVREGRIDDRLDIHSTKVKISNLYVNLRVDKPNVEYHSLVFFLRRTIFVFITFLLIRYPGIQVMCFMQMTIFYIIFIGYQDFFAKTKYKVLEIFNECILLVLSYHFLLFYQIVTETARRKDLGYSLVILISTLLVVNIMQIAGKLMSKASRYTKKKYYKFKHERAIKKKADAKWEAEKLQEQANASWLE